MPRRPGITLPGVPLHLIQRGNNRQACFFHQQDYLFYLEWLEEYAQTSECRIIHACVLMTNHVHLLITPESTGSAGDLMKRLGQRYVQYINRTYRRSGTLWEGRFRSCMTGEESYVLGCDRYVELNPVRAGIVEHPSEYRWSSYRANTQHEANVLIEPHETYQALGADLETRMIGLPRFIQMPARSGDDRPDTQLHKGELCTWEPSFSGRDCRNAWEASYARQVRKASEKSSRRPGLIKTVVCPDF